LVSGDFDFLLKTRVADIAAYRELLGNTLLRLPAVSESRTYVVMEEVKSSNLLPIKR
jgi:Lrp/AsnC family leucine-responsive transcriptional regulator